MTKSEADRAFVLVEVQKTRRFANTSTAPSAEQTTDAIISRLSPENARADTAAIEAACNSIGIQRGSQAFNDVLRVFAALDARSEDRE